ncbi:unnamed protein product [Absidia cylindrospora]
MHLSFIIKINSKIIQRRLRAYGCIFVWIPKKLYRNSSAQSLRQSRNIATSGPQTRINGTAQSLYYADFNLTNLITDDLNSESGFMNLNPFIMGYRSTITDPTVLRLAKDEKENALKDLEDDIKNAPRRMTLKVTINLDLDKWLLRLI